ARFHGGEAYDQAALREWIEESRVFRATLPNMVREYLEAAANADTASPDLLQMRIEGIREQLFSLGEPTKMYSGQLPLFPAIYRLNLEFHTAEGPPLPPVVWESQVPRSQQQINRLDHYLLGADDKRAVLHVEYQLHAYNKRQRDEQLANFRLRWVT